MYSVYTVTPYFDTESEIEYMNFKNNQDDISLLYKIIAIEQNNNYKTK